MLSDGRAYLANAWWTATFSGLAIMVTVLDKHVTLDRIGHFARGVVPNFPRLRGVHVIRTWAGLRPATPDNHPIIQLLEEPGGFCLASGHSRRGIGYAPGRGQLVAQILTGKPPSLPLEPFALGRFAVRPPEETTTR